MPAGKGKFQAKPETETEGSVGNDWECILHLQILRETSNFWV